MKNKTFNYSASVVTAASIVAFTSVASAATFSFSFSNQTGSVPGVVEGIIELPDGDGIFAATSVVITSAPVEVLPPNGTDFVPNAQFNSFEVVSGEIVSLSSNLNFLSTTNNFTLDFFGLDLTVLTNQVSGNNVESNINSVSFNPITSTPERTSLITLLGLSFLGVASKLKKKA